MLSVIIIYPVQVEITQILALAFYLVMRLSFSKIVFNIECSLFDIHICKRQAQHCF